MVNKRFVRVIFVSGKSPHEWVNVSNTFTRDFRRARQSFLIKFDAENLGALIVF